MLLKMNIWLLAGYAGSGKTTAGKILQSILPSSKILAFADKVKDFVSQKYQIDRNLCDTQEGKKSILGEKTLRQHLIDYSASHKVETKNQAIWATYIYTEMLKFPHIENWILHDWRYIEEYDFLRSIQGTIHTIRILNPSIDPLQDASEHQLDTFPTDSIVMNDGGIDILERNIRSIIHEDHTLVS